MSRKPKVSTDSVAQDQLRAFVERIERMEEEKRSIAEDIKQIYAEAKGNGFDTKVLRMVIRIRKQDHAERMEQEALLELYLSALGMASAPVEDEVAKAAEQLRQSGATVSVRLAGDADDEDDDQGDVSSGRRPAKARGPRIVHSNPIGVDVGPDV